MSDIQSREKMDQLLGALSPSEEELTAAARWSRSHDPSEGYESMLRKALAYLGVEHGDDLGT